MIRLPACAGWEKRRDRTIEAGPARAGFFLDSAVGPLKDCVRTIASGFHVFRRSSRVRAGNAAWQVRTGNGVQAFLARTLNNNLQFTKEES